MTIEHDIIARYFAPLCSSLENAPAFGLLDDTALLRPRRDYDQLLTTDALVAGVHFFPDDEAASLAVKALGVNVSDIVAKGGIPTHYLLTLALPPDLDEAWLNDFAKALADAQERFGCRLIGGDTVSTSGPLMVSITLMGECPSGTMVRRNGATPGDVVYVSGTIGDAALGLIARANGLPEKGVDLSSDLHSDLIDRYLRPQPRVELIPAINKFASAAMDVSDGLAGDFDKLCAASNVGGYIDTNKVPLSKAVKSALAQATDLLETVLSGGDDYEVLLTVPQKMSDEFEQAVENVTRMGEIVPFDQGVKLFDGRGKPLDLSHGAFDHFSPKRR